MYTRERFQFDCRKAMTLPKKQQAKALRSFQIRLATASAVRLAALYDEVPNDGAYDDAYDPYDEYVERIARTFGCESYDKMMLSLWD